jgi:hypothetical protein
MGPEEQVQADERTQPQREPHGWAFWTWIGVLCLAITAGIAAAWFEWVSKGQTTAGATVIIGLIGAVAVGIERLIELFWTFVNQKKPTWWPMDLVDERISELQNELQKDLNDKLKDLFAAARATSDEVEKAVGQVEAASRKTLQLWGDAKSNQNLKAASSQTVAQMEWVESIVGEGAKETNFQQRWAGAKATLTALDDLVDSFTDNPARRVMSIFIGMFLGLLVAGFVGIDGVDAALGRGPAAWGVIATGLLVGLGSNPTHEVIQALQEFKKSQRV